MVKELKDTVQVVQFDNDNACRLEEEEIKSSKLSPKYTNLPSHQTSQSLDQNHHAFNHQYNQHRIQGEALNLSENDIKQIEDNEQAQKNINEFYAHDNANKEIEDMLKQDTLEFQQNASNDIQEEEKTNNNLETENIPFFKRKLSEDNTIALDDYEVFYGKRKNAHFHIPQPNQQTNITKKKIDILINSEQTESYTT
jgi:hypothetical protein